MTNITPNYFDRNLTDAEITALDQPTPIINDPDGRYLVLRVQVKHG